MITYDLVEATENSNELVDNINFKKNSQCTLSQLYRLITLIHISWDGCVAMPWVDFTCRSTCKFTLNLKKKNEERTRYFLYY